MNSASQAGVHAIMVPAVDPANWSRLEQIPQIYGVSLYFSLGVHPYALAKFDPSQDQEILESLSALLTEPPERLRAIGECGLDFRVQDSSAKTRQIRVLEAHCELAIQKQLPLIIHCVKAQQTLVDLLKNQSVPPSVIHSYSGSAETAQQLLHLGHYISFSGSITNPKSKRARKATQAVPDDRLLIETDSPDQSPYSKHGTDNEPAFIVETAETLAELRNQTIEEVAGNTFNNACKVFDIDPAEIRAFAHRDPKNETHEPS